MCLRSRIPAALAAAALWLTPAFAQEPVIVVNGELAPVADALPTPKEKPAPAAGRSSPAPAPGSWSGDGCACGGACFCCEEAFCSPVFVICPPPEKKHHWFHCCHKHKKDDGNPMWCASCAPWAGCDGWAGCGSSCGCGSGCGKEKKHCWKHHKHKEGCDGGACPMWCAPCMPCFSCGGCAGSCPSYQVGLGESFAPTSSEPPLLASTQPVAPPAPPAPPASPAPAPAKPAPTTPAIPAVAPAPVAPAPTPVAAIPAPLPRVVPVLARAVSRPARPSVEECKELADAHAPGVLVTRGFGHYWQGRYTEALAHFEGALLKDPSDAHTWYGKALAERALGETRAADASLARAVNLQGDTQTPDTVLTFLLERLPSAEKSWLSAARSR